MSIIKHNFIVLNYCYDKLFILTRIYGLSFICIYGFISNPSNHFIPQYYSKIDKDPKTYASPLSTQTVNTKIHKPTNRNPLRELNLQTNQTKSQILIASNFETCSNQLSPKKRGGKRLPRDENGTIKNKCFYTNKYKN
ncbi:hypothetical protein BpHYR1_030605 [Brachionus plicatilis]|uniref:Uncharacterized protein n=1 Tax=Brachionus plicatilis TaxID=10195 RepID=A0A3M7Q3A1_BRAPC|nr:hypothetical protein BpHYR1_030605 [Brachionus plicatilis]